MLKETLSQQDILKNETLEKYVEFCTYYIALLENAQAQDPNYFPGRAQKLREVLAMMDVEHLKTDKNRTILIGEAMAILPKDTTVEEYGLAKYLTKISAKAIQAYREKYKLLKIDGIPITTFFVKTTQEVEKIARNKNYAGVISLQYPPLWNSFNIEAADCAFHKLEEELGRSAAAKAIYYSKLHEDGHLVFEQHRLAQSRLHGFPDSDFAKTFHQVYTRNSIVWEMAADEFGNSLPEETSIGCKEVFPEMVSTLVGCLDSRISLQEIMAQRNIDLYEEIMYRINPNTQKEMPFMASPNCAHVYLRLKKWAARHCISWSNLLKNYINVYPLADHDLLLPKVTGEEE